jgi:hypothetical protein
MKRCNLMVPLYLCHLRGMNKGKNKVIPVFNKQAPCYEDAWKYSSPSLAWHETGCVWLHAPATLPWGNSPGYPLYRRLGEHHGRSWHYGEEKNVLPLKGSNLNSLVSQCTACLLTELPWLHEYRQLFNHADNQLLKLLLKFICKLKQMQTNLLFDNTEIFPAPWF